LIDKVLLLVIDEVLLFVIDNVFLRVIDEISAKEISYIYQHNYFVPFGQIFGQDEDRRRRGTLILFNRLLSITSVEFDCVVDGLLDFVAG